MPLITALVHVRNDALRLGRALESLHPCDEILVIDHGSSDGTARLARQYGASVIPAPSVDLPAAYLARARHPWVLCLGPSEALTERLEAALFEWKLSSEREAASLAAGSVRVREETIDGWSEGEAVTRLVPRSWTCWEGTLPVSDPTARLLDGHLLRFRIP